MSARTTNWPSCSSASITGKSSDRPTSSRPPARAALLAPDARRAGAAATKEMLLRVARPRHTDAGSTASSRITGHERPPCTLRLRQAVGDHEQRRRVMAHAAVATPHLDVLALRTRLFEAAPPGDD